MRTDSLTIAYVVRAVLLHEFGEAPEALVDEITRESLRRCAEAPEGDARERERAAQQIVCDTLWAAVDHATMPSAGMTRPETMTGAQYQAAMAKKTGRPWSNAKRTVCAQWHPHASKLEARVCDRLTLLAKVEGVTLMQQVRLPLWNLAPDDRGRSHYCSVDFALVKDGRLVRLVESKGRVSRDWTRGAAAVEACYGLKIETVTR